MKNLKLKSFQYTNSSKGWSSPKIEFSESVTAIEGGNGSGKSPIMNGIAFSLGLEVQLPTDILENCSHAILELEILNRPLTFKRKLNEEHFYLEIFESELKICEFKGFGSIGEYTHFFLNLVGIRDVSLMSIGSREHRHQTPLYISTLIPIFYISQAKGFSTHYSPLDKQKFIANQYEEIIRALFDLPAFSPASAEEEKDAFYKKRDKIKTIIIELERKVDFFKQHLGKKMSLSSVEIEKFRDQFSQRVEDIQLSLMISGPHSSVAISDEVNHLRQELAQLNNQAFEYKFKLKGIESLEDDIQKKIEIEEDSFDAESAFQKFCSHTECSLFTSRKVPFGKKLLYLKDQLKDISKTSQQYKEDIKNIELKKELFKKQIDDVLTKPLDADNGVAKNIELLKENVNRFSEYSEAFKNKEELIKYSSLLDIEKDNLVQVTGTIQLFKGKGV
jgi:hypothetical protein